MWRLIVITTCLATSALFGCRAGSEHGLTAAPSRDGRHNDDAASAAPKQDEAVPAPRLEEQTDSARAYLNKKAALRQATYLADRARDAFVEAGSPELLHPIVKELYRRRLDLEQDVARAEANIQSQCPTPKVADDMPPGGWLRLVCEDHRHRRQREAFGMVIELSDLHRNGLCDVKLYYLGQKVKLKNLSVGTNLSAFNEFAVHVESVNRATRMASFLICRADAARVIARH